MELNYEITDKNLVKERAKKLKELRALLKHFKTTGFKNGDLVVTAEVHLVTDVAWGRKHYSSGMKVVTLFPACSTCKNAKQPCQHPRIMKSGGAGQQHMMKLV